MPVLMQASRKCDLVWYSVHRERVLGAGSVRLSISGPGQLLSNAAGKLGVAHAGHHVCMSPVQLLPCSNCIRWLCYVPGYVSEAVRCGTGLLLLCKYRQ